MYCAVSSISMGLSSATIYRWPARRALAASWCALRRRAPRVATWCSCATIRTGSASFCRTGDRRRIATSRGVALRWRRARPGSDKRRGASTTRASTRRRLRRSKERDCMAEADSTTLGALIAPGSAAEFLRDYWPDKPFAAHGDAARLPPFLRAPELDSIETLSRVYRGNLRFTSGRRYQKMLAIDQVHAASLYRMGLTVQFEDIAPFVAATPPGLRQLEAELGVARGAARASVFSSPPSDGLSVHFDAQDLFSVQLTGTKRF